jgi:phosphodiesterase/alkaline phosphatase D-like protein
MDTGITHGPVLGRLGHSHVGVWARTSQPGEFTVFYGTAADALTMTATGTTMLADDNTGWTMIQGLEPGTKYFYEVGTGSAAAGSEERSGSFHTLPDPSALKTEHNPEGRYNFRFEFACGNNQNSSGSPIGRALLTHGTMLRELTSDTDKSAVDFAILNGDWLYENDTRRYTADQWREQTGTEEAKTPREVQLMPSIVGVWENYKNFYDNGANLRAWHRNVPSYYTFDDHELLNDVYGAGEPGRRNRRAVFRDVGTRAWYDYLGWSNPVPDTPGIVYGRAQLEAGSDVLTDPEADFTGLDAESTLQVHWGTPDWGVMLLGQNPDGTDADDEGGDPNSKVYEVVEVLDANRLRMRPAAVEDGQPVYSIGRRSYFSKRVSNAEFLYLDTRSYRMMHDTKDREKVGRTMLGERQKAWVKQTMQASDADFFFIVSSVNFSISHVGGTGSANISETNKDDAWTAFLWEREDMINFWDGLGKPVFVLTGDLHNSFAIKLTDRVWEFASGPHNSTNHPLRSEGNRPKSGMYDSFGRESEIRWSSFIVNGTPNEYRRRPIYCVVQVNNVFNNPSESGDRLVAYENPQAVFQYYDGLTGELLYAESVVSR